MSKITPLWPVDDGDLRNEGIYAAGMVHRLGLVLRNEDVYNKFTKKYLINLSDAIATKHDRCTFIDSKDIHTIQVIIFKYGAPLYLFGPMKEGTYKEAYESRRKDFKETPLYVDRRIGLKAEKEKVEKVIFVLSEIINLPGEMAPRIQLSEKNRNVYTFVFANKKGIPKKSERGRLKAQEVLFQNRFKDADRTNRFKVISEDLKEYWNNDPDMTARRRKEELERALEYLGEWISGAPDETGVREQQLYDILSDDREAIEEKLISKVYEI